MAKLETIPGGRLRALATVACLGAGFAIGRAADPPLPALIVCGALGGCVGLFARGSIRCVALLLGCVLLAGAWWTLRIEMAPRDTVVVASDGLFDNLYIGEIVDLVRTGPLAQAGTRLLELCRERMVSIDINHPHKPDDLAFVVYRRGLRQ